MRIFRNPGDPAKTLVPDPDDEYGGLIQAKYAPTFRTCSVDADNNPVLFPLPVGTIVTVNAKGYEIVYGSVEEIIDEETGVKSLNTEGAFTSLDTADITLGRNTYYEVYFRKDDAIVNEGCREVKTTNCCGFDMADKVCDEPNEIGKPTGVVVSTKINFNGKPVVITGGGPIGDDKYARPPCVLVPREPLSLKFVGIFIDGQSVSELVVDGKTMNQFIFEVKYIGRAVPQGIPLDVLLKVNIEGDEIEKIGDFDIKTYFGVPNSIYTYTTTTYPGINNPGNTTVYSFASMTLNPIPTNKNIAIGVGVTTTYGSTVETVLETV